MRGVVLPNLVALELDLFTCYSSSTDRRCNCLLLFFYFNILSEVTNCSVCLFSD